VVGATGEIFVIVVGQSGHLGQVGDRVEMEIPFTLVCSSRILFCKSMIFCFSSEGGSSGVELREDTIRKFLGKDFGEFDDCDEEKRERLYMIARAVNIKKTYSFTACFITRNQIA
jgi:hypothetical protein